jgi:hypothetical protein
MIIPTWIPVFAANKKIGSNELGEASAKKKPGRKPGSMSSHSDLLGLLPQTDSGCRSAIPFLCFKTSEQT